MKKVLFFFIVLTSVLAVAAQGDSKRVLFVGNSYTEVNNLPQLVQRVAESAGDRVECQSNTPGGCTFSQHCTNRSMELIRQGGWDVVVLQEQSQLPSFPQSQVEVEVFPYARRLVDSVYAHSPEGEAMFYMTWGRKYGDQPNAIYFPVLGTYEGMDSMLYERYLYMARTYDASVSPVGRVWRYLRTTHPEIELYQSDDSHPSLAGSYAAACAFYTMLFHKTPHLITYNSELMDGQAQVIRDAVRHVVFDTLSFWLRQLADTTHNDTTQVDTTQVDTTQIDTTQIDTTQVGIIGADSHIFPSFRVCPNPATDHIVVHVSQPFEGTEPHVSRPCEAVLCDMKGRKLRVVTLSGSQTPISLSDLPGGIYLLTLVSPSDRYTVRVVKQ